MPELETLLRHRGRMLLLDRVLELGEGFAAAQVRIGPESSFYQAPEGVPGWVGIEYLAQTIALMAGDQACRAKQPVPVGYLLGTRNYRCSRPWFAAGEVLRTEVREELFDENGLGAYNCRILDGELVAECRLTVYRRPTEGFPDHE